VQYPGASDGVIGVSATDANDKIARFSSRGQGVDVAAPGVNVTQQTICNRGRDKCEGYPVYSGTSMAAPHVAGALALLKAQSPQTPMQELVDKLKATGRPYAYQAGGAQVTTPRLDVLAALSGSAPQPTISQTAAPAPEDPGDDPEPDPSDSSGPTPTPDDPQPEDPDTTPEPTPVPLPTVTVTVTDTPTPAGTAAVCTRGTTGKRLTAKRWAVEIHRGSGTIPDATLTCYLKLVQKASKVFPELTRASTLGTAYRVLKANKTARQRLDSALLTGWLNWAHGRNATTALKGAEKVRLSANAKAAALGKAAKRLSS
jgi:hypothetical protein